MYILFLYIRFRLRFCGCSQKRPNVINIPKKSFCGCSGGFCGGKFHPQNALKKHWTAPNWSCLCSKPLLWNRLRTIRNYWDPIQSMFCTNVCSSSIKIVFVFMQYKTSISWRWTNLSQIRSFITPTFHRRNLLDSFQQLIKFLLSRNWHSENDKIKREEK